MAESYIIRETYLIKIAPYIDRPLIKVFTDQRRVGKSYLLQDQQTIDREFGNLMAIKDNFPKLVISMDESFGKNSIQGIRHLHLRKFLLLQELA